MLYSLVNTRLSIYHEHPDGLFSKKFNFIDDQVLDDMNKRVTVWY